MGDNMLNTIVYAMWLPGMKEVYCRRKENVTGVSSVHGTKSNKNTKSTKD